MRKLLVRLLKKLTLLLDVTSISTYEDLSYSTEKLLKKEENNQISKEIIHSGRSFFRICRLYSILTRRKEKGIIGHIINGEIDICKNSLSYLQYLLDEKN